MNDFSISMAYSILLGYWDKWTNQSQKIEENSRNYINSKVEKLAQEQRERINPINSVYNSKGKIIRPNEKGHILELRV